MSQPHLLEPLNQEVPGMVKLVAV